MMAPRFTLSPRPVATVLALLIGLAHGTIVSAQGTIPRPHRPYNSVYDPYVYPIYPNGDGYFPNQNSLTGRSGPAQANQFQQFLDEGGLGSDPSPSGLSRSGGAGTPYYRAHRRFDPNNRPNNTEADRLFRERQGVWDTRYFRWKKYQEARQPAESRRSGPAHRRRRRRNGSPSRVSSSAPSFGALPPAAHPRQPANWLSPRRRPDA